MAAAHEALGVEVTGLHDTLEERAREAERQQGVLLDLEERLERKQEVVRELEGRIEALARRAEEGEAARRALEQSEAVLRSEGQAAAAEVGRLGELSASLEGKVAQIEPQLAQMTIAKEAVETRNRELTVEISAMIRRSGLEAATAIAEAERRVASLLSEKGEAERRLREMRENLKAAGALEAASRQQMGMVQAQLEATELARGVAETEGASLKAQLAELEASQAARRAELEAIGEQREVWQEATGLLQTRVAELEGLYARSQVRRPRSITIPLT